MALLKFLKRKNSLSCQETESLLNSFSYFNQGLLHVQFYISVYNNVFIRHFYMPWPNCEKWNEHCKLKSYIKIILYKTSSHYCILIILILLKINILVSFNKDRLEVLWHKEQRVKISYN